MAVMTCECGKRFGVSEDLAGRRIKCPGCGATLSVPEGEKVTTTRRRPDPEKDDREDDRPAPRRREEEDEPDDRPARRGGSILPWVIGGGVLLLVLVIVAAVILARQTGQAMQATVDQSKSNVARAQMKVIENACEVYRLNHTTLPPNLQTLLQPDPENGGAAYFRDPQAIIDPWGNPYLYEADDALGPTIGCKTPEGKIITNIQFNGNNPPGG
jgi:hypothetical protein